MRSASFTSATDGSSPGEMLATVTLTEYPVRPAIGCPSALRMAAPAMLKP